MGGVVRFPPPYSHSLGHGSWAPPFISSLFQQVEGRGLELRPRQKLNPSSPPSDPPGQPHLSRLSLGPSWTPLSR